MLTRLVLLTYPILVMATAYQLLGNHYRVMQGQQAPSGYYTELGEGLPDEYRFAIVRAKRWVESNMMGGGASLDARYQVREGNDGYDVHVVFVSGYSPTGAPIYLPNGHYLVRFTNHDEVDALSSPIEAPVKEIVLARNTHEYSASMVQPPATYDQ